MSQEALTRQKKAWVGYIYKLYGCDAVEIAGILKRNGLLDGEWDPDRQLDYNTTLKAHFANVTMLVEKAKMTTPKPPEPCPYCEEGEKQWDRSYSWRCSAGGLHCFLGYRLYKFMEENYGTKEARKAKEAFEERAKSDRALENASNAEIRSALGLKSLVEHTSTDKRTPEQIYWAAVAESAFPSSVGGNGKDTNSMGQDAIDSNNGVAETLPETMGNVA